jgi:ABC-type transport system substrate-binding protein
VQTRGSGLWPLPAHTIAADGDGLVTVKWATKPAFGPFLLDGAPLWQPAHGGPYKFQCAGAHRPENTPFGLSLRPTPGYAFKTPPPSLDLYDAGQKPAAPAAFEFRHADQFSAANSCPKIVVDLPAATLIAWNTRRGPTADPAFRALLTQLSPRGALIRSGSSQLGELLSAPIPRAHPGYNQAVLVRPFDLDATAAALDKLGYKRKSPDGARLDKDGKQLVLTIKADRGAASLAAKVIVDAFNSVGIQPHFEDEMAEGEPDGFLAAVSLDWPRADLLGNFHSKLAKPEPFWPLSDPALDALLESYATSLTWEKPSFSTLQQIHKKLYELEPVTVLLQHKTCLDPRGAPKPVGKINARDPDWFRQLLF